MTKIIAAFDGLKFSESTLKHTLFIARQTQAHVVGVFLDDFIYHSYGYKEMVAYGSADLDNQVHQWNDQDASKRDEAANHFSEACQKEGISFTIHRDRNIAIQELLHESIYADLLVIDWNETFTHFEENPPTPFIRDLLTDVQCPVLLVPGMYYPMKKLILLYDGEPSSVYAVKMFSYLLSGFRPPQTEVLSIKPEDEPVHLPDNRLMKEFMKRHFPKAEYHLFKGNPEDQIISFLATKKEHALIVLGAYRRGRVSRWFKPSMADHLMKHLKMPLFIAHNK